MWAQEACEGCNSLRVIGLFHLKAPSRREMNSIPAGSNVQ